MATDLKCGASGLYRFRGARFKAAQDILQGDIIYKTITSRKRLIPCYAGRLTLVLTETGDVYPCESFEHRMGNVRESGYDIRGLLRGKDAKDEVRRIIGGGCFCSHECYMIMNILFNPLMYPSLLKKYFNL